MNHKKKQVAAAPAHASFGWPEVVNEIDLLNTLAEIMSRKPPEIMLSRKPHPMHNFRDGD